MGIGGEMAWSSTTIHCPTGAVHRPLHFRSSGRRTCRPTSWIEDQSRTNIQSPSHRLPFLLKIKLFISSWRNSWKKSFGKFQKENSFTWSQWRERSHRVAFAFVGVVAEIVVGKTIRVPIHPTLVVVQELTDVWNFARCSSAALFSIKWQNFSCKISFSNFEWLECELTLSILS